MASPRKKQEVRHGEPTERVYHVLCTAYSKDVPELLPELMERKAQILDSEITV